jgi:aryl-alcohol dehydrogenase-like predicted oxidoreductase
MAYGVANNAGQVSLSEGAKILSVAASAGIDTLDTAIVYGDSEQRLGELSVARWQVVSKLPAVPLECVSVTDWVQESVQGSLNRLQVAKLKGLLLHKPEQLMSAIGPELYSALHRLKADGKVEKIGVSIYSPDELDQLTREYALDLVQVPFNVVDRRISTSGWLERLYSAGVEVHLRSIFLQGLLLMSQQGRPRAFDRWNRLWTKWHEWLQMYDALPAHVCLAFALSQPGISRVIVGVDTSSQLRGLLESLQGNAVVPPPELACEDIELVNPSLWKYL